MIINLKFMNFHQLYDIILSIYFFFSVFPSLFLIWPGLLLPKNEWIRAIFLVLESTLNFFTVLQKCTISQIIIEILKSFFTWK